VEDPKPDDSEGVTELPKPIDFDDSPSACVGVNEGLNKPAAAPPVEGEVNPDKGTLATTVDDDPNDRGAEGAEVIDPAKPDEPKPDGVCCVADPPLPEVGKNPEVDEVANVLEPKPDELPPLPHEFVAVVEVVAERPNGLDPAEGVPNVDAPVVGLGDANKDPLVPELPKLFPLTVDPKPPVDDGKDCGGF